MMRVHKKEEQEVSPFSKITNNFIYIIMFFAILVSFVYGIYYKYFSYTEDTTPGSEKSSKIFTLLIIALCVAIVIIFLIHTVKSSQDFQMEAKIEPIVQKSFVKKISKKDYANKGKEITERELKKLYDSQDFKEMASQKGNDPKNWIWQTQEKEKKTVWKEEDDINSEELENLSFDKD